jgi:hypothetical protein
MLKLIYDKGSLILINKRKVIDQEPLVHKLLFRKKKISPEQAPIFRGTGPQTDNVIGNDNEGVMIKHVDYINWLFIIELPQFKLIKQRKND